MKNKEIDLDDYDDEVFANEQAFNKRFRKLEGDELAEHKLRIARIVGEKKSRVTIYFDADIVRSFKARSELLGIGYQTLMNEALRREIDGAAKLDVKEELLKDRKFLKRLKAALAS